MDQAPECLANGAMLRMRHNSIEGAVPQPKRQSRARKCAAPSAVRLYRRFSPALLDNKPCYLIDETDHEHSGPKIFDWSSFGLGTCGEHGFLELGDGNDVPAFAPDIPMRVAPTLQAVIGPPNTLFLQADERLAQASLFPRPREWR